MAVLYFAAIGPMESAGCAGGCRKDGGQFGVVAGPVSLIKRSSRIIGAQVPAKIQRFTLMCPIHGNL